MQVRLHGSQRRSSLATAPLGPRWPPASLSFSRERLRRVLRKKTSAEELRLIYLHLHIFTSAHPLLIFTSTFTTAHLHLCSSSHPHITSTFTTAHLHLCSSSHPHIYISHLHLSLFLTFSLKAGGSTAGAPRNATLCGDRACRANEMQARVRFGFVAGNPLRRSCVSSARNAGESAIWLCPAQASAEIVLVEGAKCRRECDLSGSRATLCGDRACRVREMQARVRFVFVAGNPLRRSCVSSARNAGERTICVCPAQPSAEIVRVVECAKCRRECPARRNPLRRSCVSSARNAGKSAIRVCPAQHSAEIVRVEHAKCRRECDLCLS